MMSAQLKNFTLTAFYHLIEYNHLLSILACNPGTPSCYLGECDYFGKTGHLKQMLLDIFEENDVEEVTYKSWVMVDRTSLETITKSTAAIVENFAEKKIERIATTGF